MIKNLNLLASACARYNIDIGRLSREASPAIREQVSRLDLELYTDDQLWSDAVSFFHLDQGMSLSQERREFLALGALFNRAFRIEMEDSI